VSGADICQFSMVVENCALLGYYAVNPEQPSSNLLCGGSLKSSIIVVY
jgi:hypothetical protein